MPTVGQNVNAKDNEKCINYDDAISDNVSIINECVDQKARDKHVVHFPLIQVHTNGVVRIQCK